MARSKENGSSPAERQLLIDMSVIARHDAGTGIQRVVRAVYSELRTLAPAGVILRPVAASAQLEYRYLPDGFLDQAGDVKLEECRLVAVSDADIFLGLDLTSSIMPRHEQQIASWRAAGVTIHIVVYDLLPLLHRAWFRRPTRRHFRRWLGVIERQADQVICNAADVAQAFRRWNGRWRLAPSRRVSAAVVPLSGEITASRPSRGLPANASEILEWMRRRHVVLMVGTVEPRKGYDQAMAAFAQLWRRHGDAAPALLVVGRPGWKTRKLQSRMRKNSSLEGPFLWLEDVSDEFLEKLYGSASGLLFASRGEGYGLPLVEAQCFGLPALVRDLPVLEQNMTPSTTSFSGNRSRDLAEAIEAWLGAEGPVFTSPPVPLRSWREVAIDLCSVMDIAVTTRAVDRADAIA